jgi:hypothetical protein
VKLGIVSPLSQMWSVALTHYILYGVLVLMAVHQGNCSYGSDSPPLSSQNGCVCGSSTMNTGDRTHRSPKDKTTSPKDKTSGRLGQSSSGDTQSNARVPSYKVSQE